MIPARFRELVVEHDRSRDYDGHCIIFVRSTLPRAVDILAPLVDGFDPQDADHWLELTSTAVDLAGILARVAVAVTPSVVLGPPGHRCDRSAQSLEYFDEDERPEPEIERATFGDGQCGVYLGNVARGDILDDARLPSLEVTVPANRLRSWLAHLAAQIEDVQRGDLEQFLKAPAIAAACQSTEGNNYGARA